MHNKASHAVACCCVVDIWDLAQESEKHILKITHLQLLLLQHCYAFPSEVCTLKQERMTAIHNAAAVQPG